MLMEDDVDYDRMINVTQPSTTDSMSLASATQLLINMQAQIRTADDKIRALFGATALLAAALSFTTQQRLSQSLSGGWSLFTLFELLARSLLFFVVVVTVAAAVFALMPRVRTHNTNRSLFFFGHIADTPHDAFIHEFRTLSEPDAMQQILSQVHVNAQIVCAKYVWAGRAATGLLTAIVLWSVLQFITFFA